MTVIRPNSVSGITSITAQANEINVFRSNGTLAGLNLNGVNFNTTAGISTLAALKVTGNVDIAGVLTYQDVTNVDSLGIGTFRTGINVSGGQLDVGSNIKLGNAGVGTFSSINSSTSPNFIIKDGTTEKGYIGFNGNDPFIGRKNGVGVAFQNNKIRPVDGDDGSGSNNTVDIGENTYKFKDAYFSGTVTANSYAGDGSNLTGITGTTINNNADNRLITGSGTANTLEGEANLTFNGTKVILSNSQSSTISDRGFQVNASSNLTDGQILPAININPNTNTHRTRAGIAGISHDGTAGMHLAFFTRYAADGTQLSSSNERLRILSDGKVLIGHTSNIFNYKLAIFGTDGGNSGIAASRFSNNTSPASLLLSKSRSATIGNFAVLQDDDEVGMIDFRGADGSDNMSKVAEIKASIDGTPGSNDMPGRLTFHTTADGASTTTERLRITSQGLVGINVTSPSQALHVSGNIINSTSVNSTGDKGIQMGNGHRLGFDQSGTRSWTIKATGGNLTFNSGDGNGTHYFYTDIASSGSIDSASDIKLKTNIKTIDNALDKVLHLRGVEFDRVDSEDHQIGVIAQEVEKIIPEVVHGDDTKTVSYGNLVGLLIEAIKQQNVEINNLKKIIKNLES